MRKLLIPLLAALVFPIAVNAESVCKKMFNSDIDYLGKIDMGAGATQFLVVSPTASIEDIKGIAKLRCGMMASSRFCRLMIWDNIKYANNRFPLSEISAEKQIATYIYNPFNKSEKLIVRGEEVPMGKCSNKR